MAATKQKPSSAGGGAGSTEKVPSVQPTIEVGQSGLKRSGGIVTEEYLAVLRGPQFFKTINEMLNDPLINGVLFAIDSLIRQVKWSVLSGGDTPADDEAKQFLEECMEDMSHTWSDFISEVLTMLPFGFAPLEIVYKKRQGDVKDGSSKYDDGRIGWRKIALRAQETVAEWLWDEAGGLQGFVQQLPEGGAKPTIPIEKCLLFRTTVRKQNPEGRSLLRGAYRSYYFKKRMEEIEAIGIERDLAGFPIMRLPAELMSADATAANKAVYDAYQRILRNIRRDEQEGIIMPSTRDASGNLMYEFELMSSGGARSFDTSGIIERYNKTIAMSMLADFILLGHEGVGSFALSSDKTSLFSVSLGSILLSIKEVINSYGVKRLFALNGFSVEKLPELTYEDIETPDLAELGAYISAITGAGMPLFPNEELQEHLMQAANLPYNPEKIAQEQADVPEPPQPPVPGQPPEPGAPKKKVKGGEQLPTDTSPDKDQVKQSAVPVK